MMRAEKVILGCERLIERRPGWFSSTRLGLLANQASVTSSLENVGSLIKKGGGRLSCFFSPQHGFYAEKQANMVESSNDWDFSHSVPIYSLYGTVRQPSIEMIEKIDVLLIDLQDVGTRVYTYGTTMGLCLEAAAQAGIKVVVLDRPNPIGGMLIEGNVLKEGYRSFVGRYHVPMRHGLTMGELARFVAKERHLDCDLEVIPMQGWKRGDLFPDTRLQWVFPSPNMPSWDTALLYPGMVLLEGTNVSEGRGTTLPFQVFGAPFIDQQKVLDVLRRSALEGVVFRPICFEPVFDKWQGRICAGFQIHINEREKLRPYRLGLAVLGAILQVHGDEFRWLPPPYEYEWEKLPIDILIGDGAIREKLENRTELPDLEAGWAEELEAYRMAYEDCLIYGE
ncbi:MAG: exo-beta-N-acetylmuramidase NamZ domain-containing protein [Syntrophobacteraceae bacterium]